MSGWMYQRSEAEALRDRAQLETSICFEVREVTHEVEPTVFCLSYAPSETGYKCRLDGISPICIFNVAMYEAWLAMIQIASHMHEHYKQDQHYVSSGM